LDFFEPESIKTRAACSYRAAFSIERPASAADLSISEMTEANKIDQRGFLDQRGNPIIFRTYLVHYEKNNFAYHFDHFGIHF
jgi:hypothetical protein